MNNDLFLKYLIEVNTIKGERPKKRSIRSIEALLIIILLGSAGLMTIWAIAQEIMVKLR